MEKHKESVGIGLHVPIMRLFFFFPFSPWPTSFLFPLLIFFFFCAPLRRRRQRRLSRFAPSRHTAIQEKARFLFPNCLSCLSACLSCPFFSIHFTAFIYLYFFFIFWVHTLRLNTKKVCPSICFPLLERRVGVFCRSLRHRNVKEKRKKQD